MILALDDNPVRLRCFKQGLIGTPLVTCSRADDALRLLNQHTPKVVFLDYDLDQFGDLTAGNGMEVVNWLLMSPVRWRDTLFVVHSVNPLMGPTMHAKLRAVFPRSIYHPMAWENKTLLDQAAHLSNRPG